METDLKRIARLARSRWADNWNFRSYLKMHVAPAKLDAVVHKHHAEVSAAIDCTQCANCCKEIHPILSQGDVSRLAKGQNLTNAEFRARYVRRDESEDEVFCKLPCPLLKENRCSVYKTRPDDCRSYPHLHKDGFLERSIGIIENYRLCPIVFNVYERLKASFAYDPSVDYIGDSDPEAES